jgi:dTDP-4-dehydrorhamnose reductase
MNILVTGASGLLGNAIYDHFKSSGDHVQSFVRAGFLTQTHRQNVELLKKFDCIIHAAANTDVEACEIHPEDCYKDNTLVTERLAMASSVANCKFVYISSTGIYGTEKENGPYSEYDAIHPTTHHHNSKWLGECAVNQYCNNSLILRAGWLFGGSPENKKNFVARRIEEAVNARDSHIFSNSHQVGSPTFINDFVSRLYSLVRQDDSGTFNIVNDKAASRLEYVQKIIELAELPVQVMPIAAGFFNRKANVSSNESAISLKLDQLGYAKLPDWPRSLEAYINTDLKSWISEIKCE